MRCERKIGDILLFKKTSYEVAFSNKKCRSSQHIIRMSRLLLKIK